MSEKTGPTAGQSGGPSLALAIEIRASANGARMRLRVRPGARKSAIEGERLGALKISVHAPPEKGKANEEVRRLLAETMKVPPSLVQVVSGLGSRDQVVEIATLAPEQVRSLLASVTG